MAVPNPTEIVQRIERIDDDASAELLPLVYDQLRILAAAYLRRQPQAQSILPTDLVHEAFIRLIDRSISQSKDRAHFFAVASRAMRNVLVDHARKRLADKRGGGWHRISFSESKTPSGAVELDLLDLDEALVNLSAMSERAGQVIELRFFGGLTIPETAEVIGASIPTINDDWAFARVWLERELDKPDDLRGQ